MASGTRKYAADSAYQVNDVFTLSAEDRDVTITNFDSLSMSGSSSHDLIDLTAIFDSLGGKFTDGQNDVNDRKAALQFQTGDFDGDGKADDLRLTISGVKDFAVTLINPVDSTKSSYGIFSQSSGSASDIVVGGVKPVIPPVSPTESAIDATTTGQTPLYNKSLQAFAIDADHQITINGVVDTYTSNVLALVYHGGDVYQQAGTGSSSGWWQYTPGSGWHDWTVVGSDPRDVTSTPSTPTTHAPSADGSWIAAGGAPLYNGASDSFSVNANHQVVIDGVADGYTGNVLGLLYKDGSIYQEAGNPSSPGWWQYTPGSGWHDWSEVASDPRTTTSGSTGQTPTPVPVPSTPDTGTGLYMDKYPDHWARLSNGINIERSEFGKVSDTDMKYLHDIGVQNFRAFLCPTEYLTAGKAMDPEHNGWIQNLKGFMDKAVNAGMAVVVSPFASVHPAFMDNPNDTASINQYVSWMKEFAGWVKAHYNPQDVVIETFNEPVLNTGASDAQDSKTWWGIQEKLVSAVHQVAPDFTVEATANFWDSPDYLEQMTAYNDPNVVYQVHYYRPMSFTHQGASWVSWAANLHNVQWPGADGMTLSSVQNDLAKIKGWADSQGAFVDIGEFGVINNAPADDKAQWLSDLRTTFDKYGWGWDVWDYNKSFGITTSDAQGRETVIDSYLKALDWGKYSAHDSPWEALHAAYDHIAIG